MIGRLWQHSVVRRWAVTFASLLRGTRVHPEALLLGPRSRIVLGHGAKVSRGCVIRTEGDGRVELGAGVWLARDVEIETGGQVHIGTRTTIQRRCSLNGNTRVGADCIFAPDVFVSSSTHPFRHVPHLPIREQERLLAMQGRLPDAPVWIQDDCWLGTHVVVSPGVTLGKGCVVGANSVVTGDVAPYSVVAGSPARPIGQRLAWRAPAHVDATRETDLPYVIEGMAARDEGGVLQGIAGIPGMAIVVALAPRPMAAVRVGFACTGPAEFECNGQRFVLDAASLEATLPPAVPGPFGEALFVTLSVTAPAGTTLTFKRFEAQYAMGADTDD